MLIMDCFIIGIVKGEFFLDVGEMFNNYGDCVVLWDNYEFFVYEMMCSLCIFIINVGNGLDEYFIQVLVDFYMILKWKLELVVIGDDKVDLIWIGVVGVFNQM